MSKVVVYIHGKGGNYQFADHFTSLFPNDKVIGFDYSSENPWSAKEEFPKYYQQLREEYDEIVLVADSLGAYFSLYGFENLKIEKAYFISPIVDMEELIANMMSWFSITEEQLKQKGVIETEIETLSWQYLSWVRNNPVNWNVETEILYAGNDNMQTRDTIMNFAEKVNGKVTVMEDGEHWFHTEEQLAFLDNWIIENK